MATKAVAHPTDSANLNAATFNVQGYKIVGNTSLPQETINRAFANAIGSEVKLPQVFKGLASLRLAYHENGFLQADVKLPQQQIADGVVIINVSEGAQSPMSNAIVKPSKPLTFEVRKYRIAGNSILKQPQIDRIFSKAMGPAITVDQIRQAVGDLQLAYRERGYVTVAVSLPQQQITNATVKVKVTEGKLAAIRVTENRFFSSNNVMRALPSLETNTLLNSHVFQRELDIANANRDRQIYPTISPGPAAGTTALNLKVKDRLPLHVRADLDNYSTPNTPDLRMNFAVQYNNLWQQEHKVGFSYGFTPQEMKTVSGLSDTVLNRPLIAYYGGFYRMPFGNPTSLTEEINTTGNFGYDEATHQFRLPPVGDRADFTFYGSSSSSDTGVKLGPTTVVVNNPLITIESQDSGQNLTINDAVGGRFSIPLVSGDRTRFGVSLGGDFKHYALTSFNTNNFRIITIVTNTQGPQVIETQLASPQPVREEEVVYTPLFLGADFSEKDDWGTTGLSLGSGFNFGANSTDFSSAAYTPKATARYAKVNLSLNREQKLGGDWTLSLRANGQAANGPLINNEQFALGGVNSVRGYFDGEEYGDMGWASSVELTTPYLLRHVASLHNSVPTWLRGSVFMDYGQRYLFESTPGLPQTRSLWGVGFGLSANIYNHIEARVVTGFPLLDTPFSPFGQPRVYFTLGGQY